MTADDSREHSKVGIPWPLIFGPSAPRNAIGLWPEVLVHQRPPLHPMTCSPAASVPSFIRKRILFLCVSNSIPYIELYYIYIELYRIDCIVVIYQFHAVCSSFCYFLIFVFNMCLYSHSLNKSVSHGQQLRIQKVHVGDPSLLDEGWVDAMLPHTRAPRELPLWR